MMVRLVNAQHGAPVPLARLTRLARRAVRRLCIRGTGTIAITFIDGRRMRRMNREFCRHDWVTDVITFRYDGEPTAGEIFVAPSQARQYARRHGLAYADELSRYVVHGLLHWTGKDDRTPAQQQAMRRMENALLAA
jgi:probable rRNA maturation factor